MPKKLELKSGANGPQLTPEQMTIGLFTELVGQLSRIANSLDDHLLISAKRAVKEELITKDEFEEMFKEDEEET